MHRHIVKAEDIINRGGGTLVLELFNSDADGSIASKTEVEVRPTGASVRQPAGGLLACSRARASPFCRASGTPSGARAATSDRRGLDRQ